VRQTSHTRLRQEMNEWVLMAVRAVANLSEVEHIMELYRSDKDTVSKKVILYAYICFYIKNVCIINACNMRIVVLCLCLGVHMH